MSKRLETFCVRMNEASLDGMFINNLKNIYYLTGFWGSNGVVFITNNRQMLIIDARYRMQARKTVSDFEIVESRDVFREIVSIIKGDQSLTRIGFEDDLSIALYCQFKKCFNDLEIVPVSKLVEGIRAIKDADEIEKIRRACEISDQVFQDVLDFIQIGKTEIEITNFLDFRIRELGGTGTPFETIVASGPHSSMPHATPTNRKIQAGEAIILDFGCLYEHYSSDMTRTVYVSDVSCEEGEIYNAVLMANQALIREVQEGLSGAEFDGIPRCVIEDAGYGDYFIHGIGHGIGLDVHEEPFLHQKSDDFIQTNMVLTDEPGIYFDNRYGVRIEDDLLITEMGCEVLTHSPKELIII